MAQGCRRRRWQACACRSGKLGTTSITYRWRQGDEYTCCGPEEASCGSKSRHGEVCVWFEDAGGVERYVLRWRIVVEGKR